MRRLVVMLAYGVGVAIMWTMALSMICAVAIAIYHGFNPSGFPTDRQF